MKWVLVVLLIVLKIQKIIFKVKEDIIDWNNVAGNVHSYMGDMLASVETYISLHGQNYHILFKGLLLVIIRWKIALDKTYVVDI